VPKLKNLFISSKKSTKRWKSWKKTEVYYKYWRHEIQ